MSIKGKINYILFKTLPCNQYLKVLCLRYHKRHLDVVNPTLFTEKLFLSKARNGQGNMPLVRECYDKYRARTYVEKKVGSKYLARVYGLWDDPQDIDFSKLPNECVFKVTQSSGCNIICLDLEHADEKKIVTQLGEWLNSQNDKKKMEEQFKVESYYFDQNSKILCEELLKDEDAIPNDMRFYCFSGRVAFISVDYESVSPEGVKLSDYYRNVYDREGNFRDVEFGRENNTKYKFPDIHNLDEMIEVAEKLAEPFPFVRVDLYNIKDRIVFGELTWIPQGGAGQLSPVSFDEELGRLFKWD